MYSIGNLKTLSSVPHRFYSKWFVQGGSEGKQEEDFINIERDIPIFVILKITY